MVTKTQRVRDMNNSMSLHDQNVYASGSNRLVFEFLMC